MVSNQPLHFSSAPPSPAKKLGCARMAAETDKDRDFRRGPGPDWQTGLKERVDPPEAIRAVWQIIFCRIPG